VPCTADHTAQKDIKTSQSLNNEMGASGITVFI
jgi:hypothetical protein